VVPPHCRCPTSPDSIQEIAQLATWKAYALAMAMDAKFIATKPFSLLASAAVAVIVAMSDAIVAGREEAAYERAERPWQEEGPHSIKPLRRSIAGAAARCSLSIHRL
jgi:hypothetical protein